jgi:hypothetical protein
MAIARLDRKGFLKSLGLAAAALVARPASAGAAAQLLKPAAKAPQPLAARKAPGAVSRRADLA